MSNWGAGLAGLTSGIANGITLGRQIRGAIDENQLAQVRAQGLAEAQAAQAAATPQIQDNGDANNLTSNPQASQDPNATPEPINTSLTAAIQGAQDAQSAPDADARAAGIKTYAVQAPEAPQSTDQLSSTPLASAAPDATPDAGSAAPSNLDAAARSGLAPLTPAKRFNVNGQGFDTQEDAAAYVKKQTPDLSTFYSKTLVPKMKDALVAQGKIDQAAAWQKYADEDQTQTNAKTWLKAVQLSQFEDYNGAAEQLMKLHPHFDDGVDLLSSTPTKGPNGEDGFTMKIRDQDGSEKTIYQDSKTITELGLTQLSPIEAFNKRFARQTQADSMAARATIDQQNDQRTLNRSLLVAGVQAGSRQKVAETNTEARKDVAKTNNDAKSARQTSEDAAKSARIDQAAKNRIAQLDHQLQTSGQYRKGVSPQEREAMVVTHLASDPMFNMLSPADRQKKVAETLALLPKPTAAPAQTVPNPMQQGIQTSSVPAAPAAPAGKTAVPVFNPATGKIENVFR